MDGIGGFVTNAIKRVINLCKRSFTYAHRCTPLDIITAYSCPRNLLSATIIPKYDRRLAIITYGVCRRLDAICTDLLWT